MTMHFHARIACALAFLLLNGTALAQEQKPAAPTVRAEIGKPIQAALEALKQKNGKDALARLAEAEAIGDKTPYELYVLERLRAQAAVLLGDAHPAARAFETAALSAAAPAAEKLPMLAAAVGQYYTAKDYRKATEVADRYVREGGSERTVRTLLVQALYLGGDFARAATEIAADIAAEEQLGKAPPEEQLQMLAGATQKQGDAAGYATAMEKLVTYHPKRDYWLAVVHAVTTRPNFSARLALDLARLKLALGTLKSAAEYVEAAQLSLQEGLPAEAGRFIELGYAARLLGSGAEADRHKRLKAMAAKDLAEDRRTRAQDEAQAIASGDDTVLVNTGFNLVLNGEYDKGLGLMEQGLRKGRVKRLDEARLHLGYAFHLAGRKQRALDAFKAVQGTDGSAALARLWAIHLGKKTGG